MWACLLLLGTWSTGVEDEAQVLSSVTEIMRAPAFRNSRWGILVRDRASGEALQSLEADRLFIPASTTKLFSTAAALDALGGDHRFRTTIYRRGKVDAEGTLKGDLVLVASGDPTLGGRTTENGEIEFTKGDHTYETGAVLTSADPLTGIDALARQVAAHGIRKIDGDIVVDTRLFQPIESTGSGPNRVWPITINDNVVDLIIRPGAVGEPASVDWRPKSLRILVDARVTTAAADTDAKVEIVTPTPGSIVVRGSVPAPSEGKNKEIIRIVEIPDPPSFARGVLIEALARAGVSTRSSALEANPPIDGFPAKFSPEDKVAEFESPPFSENLRLILKVSHNLHASQLPLLVALAKGESGTLKKGLRRQGEFLRAAGVDVDTISFGGGAGGAPSDLVTPHAACQLLMAMAKRPDFAVYERALPILGVDGTVADAVPPDSPAKGNVRAKTGTFWWENTMNDKRILTSKALAGYLATAKGREVVFAIFVNYVHMTTVEERQRIGKILGQICERWVVEL